MHQDDDSRITDMQATAGRDAGKTFRINEVPPLEMATFVLRLLAALRLAQVAELEALLKPRGKSDADADSEDTEMVATILRVLTGCDPIAVRALLTDVLAYVQIAPDAQHPTTFRRLNDSDIREMATLGGILRSFVQNHMFG